jgi:S-formylglutathione hydrolase FrmB
MRDWSLLDGLVPGTAALIGAMALVFLLARTGRDWWLVKVPIAAAVSAGIAAGGAWLVNHALRLFPDTLPVEVLFWIGAAVFAILLAIMRFWGTGWGSRMASMGAALLVLVAAGSQANVYYGQYPTVGALAGTTKPELTAFAMVPRERAKTVSPIEGRSLEEIWTPPPNLPAHGTVSIVAIPAKASGFAARDAEIYLPPAYAADRRPLLPVLVLLPGQPGSPSDWFGAGQVAAAMDSFAARHHGLAPVVVAADPNGSTFAGPTCTGSAETYLTQDVPAWIAANLQVDRSGWGVGGYSAGGTCALQLALRAPEIYPSFITISGESSPGLGDEPVAGIAGYLAVGDHDSGRAEQQRIRAACRRAGIRVEYRELSGGHTWGVWRPALALSLSWYAHRSGLF